MDITLHLKPDDNQVEVRVTPTRRNQSIGLALKGDNFYEQYKGRQNTLMPASLIGPVTVRRVAASQ